MWNVSESGNLAFQGNLREREFLDGRRMRDIPRQASRHNIKTSQIYSSTGVEAQHQNESNLSHGDARGGPRTAEATENSQMSLPVCSSALCGGAITA